MDKKIVVKGWINQYPADKRPDSNKVDVNFYSDDQTQIASEMNNKKIAYAVIDGMRVELTKTSEKNKGYMWLASSVSKESEFQTNFYGVIVDWPLKPIS